MMPRTIADAMLAERERESADHTASSPGVYQMHEAV